ncbi:hypothetical protein IHE44_0011845 [Lamprotornis superbus]|uniref:Solute carrier family 15 member 5 n=1 Tax=Lamprotornis superbus TaxID=245042 RepID=A0A835NUA1_9PASS|nr:hypothetical protein IHE44_0011845 [Lamprotornis superbus]
MLVSVSGGLYVGFSASSASEDVGRRNRPPKFGVSMFILQERKTGDPGEPSTIQLCPTPRLKGAVCINALRSMILFSWKEPDQFVCSIIHKDFISKIFKKSVKEKAIGKKAEKLECNLGIFITTVEEHRNIPATQADLLKKKKKKTSMPAADSRDSQEKRFLNHMAGKETQPLTGRGTHAGKLPGAEKKLHEAVCVLLVELCERFTFFGIVCNMILFCTAKLGYRGYQAAMVNMCFVGTSTLSPVLLGWLAEHLVGRVRLVCICMVLHFLGTALLPVVSFPFEDVYIDRRHILLTLPKREQKIIFYFALLTASLGIGGIRAIGLQTVAGGHQRFAICFQEFHWLVNLNSAVVFVSISYIQQSVARNLGFLIPFVSGLMAMITIHMLRGEMIYKPKTDSSLLTTFGVICSALRTSCARHRCFSTGSWLDLAKENHGGHYSESQVEGTKSLTRLFPLFTFQILYRTCIVQLLPSPKSTKKPSKPNKLTYMTKIPSGYYLQTMNSNLHFSGFFLPVAAMNVISIVPLLILVPILECINSWLFSSKDTGHSPTIYIGHLCAALSVLVAGFSEIHRKRFPQVEQTLSKEVLLVSSMPCFHLAPQYILLGVAEALRCFRHLSIQIASSAGKFFKLEVILIQLIKQLITVSASFLRYNNLHEDCTNEFRGNPGEKLLKHEKTIKHYNAVLESQNPVPFTVWWKSSQRFVPPPSRDKNAFQRELLLPLCASQQASGTPFNSCQREVQQGLTVAADMGEYPTVPLMLEMMVTADPRWDKPQSELERKGGMGAGVLERYQMDEDGMGVHNTSTKSVSQKSQAAGTIVMDVSQGLLCECDCHHCVCVTVTTTTV